MRLSSPSHNTNISLAPVCPAPPIIPPNVNTRSLNVSLAITPLSCFLRDLDLGPLVSPNVIPGPIPNRYHVLRQVQTGRNDNHAQNEEEYRVCSSIRISPVPPHGAKPVKENGPVKETWAQKGNLLNTNFSIGVNM
jgi:hypothetical protein